eukprot:3291882-Pyramimonas_sp.AAC.1
MSDRVPVIFGEVPSLGDPDRVPFNKGLDEKEASVLEQSGRKCTCVHEYVHEHVHVHVYAYVHA